MYVPREAASTGDRRERSETKDYPKNIKANACARSIACCSEARVSKWNEKCSKKEVHVEVGELRDKVFEAANAAAKVARPPNSV